MEYFLEGSVTLRLWKFNSEEKICICYSSHNWVNVPVHICLNRAIPSREFSIKVVLVLNEETLFMFCQD